MSFSLFNSGKRQLNVIIFAQGRTGSTVLEDLLQSTGHFVSHGEVLNTRNVECGNIETIMHSISNKASPKNCTCQVKIYQLARDISPPVDAGNFLRIMQATGWRIVYLNRKNKVKQALSTFTALHRNVYHTEELRLDDVQFEVDLRQLIGHINKLYLWERDERHALAGLDFIELNYEDHLLYNNVHQQTIDNLVTSFGLSRKKVKTKHQKVNKQPLFSLISNYPEFYRELKNNNWDHFIDEN